MQDTHFHTTNFSLAVFLLAKGERVFGVNPIGFEHKEFVFAISDSIDDRVKLYRFAPKDDERLLVPVHAYEQARRELLDRLNE